MIGQLPSDTLSAWKARMLALEEAVGSTPMLVLVWGPSAGDEKRQQIVDSLRAVPHTDVATPEELLDEGLAPSLGDDVWFQEEAQATEANLIVCLIKNGRTGAPAEITKFKDHEDIVPKVRLVRPKDLENAGAILMNAVGRFPASQTMKYTPAMLIRCDRIRSRCREWLAAARTEKFRAEWRPQHPVR